MISFLHIVLYNVIMQETMQRSQLKLEINTIKTNTKFEILSTSGEAKKLKELNE